MRPDMDTKLSTVPVKKVANVPFNSTESEYISAKKSFSDLIVSPIMVSDKFILRNFIVCTFNYLDDQSYLLSTDVACMADKHVDMITLRKIK